jgi:hypothetical protein
LTHKRERFLPRFRLLLVPIWIIAGLTTVLAQKNQSVYTSLEEKRCRKLKSDSSDYLGRCPGFAGYTVLVSEGDLRQNITIITPRGTRHSLDLWTVISGGFSSLGPRAEWRARTEHGKLVPVALIVRYNASENPEQPNKTTSYLAVSKITATEICVTDKIAPEANANEAARLAADEAVNKPCLKR